MADTSVRPLSFTVRRTRMRRGITSALDLCLGVAALVIAAWVGTQLWGPADSLIMDVSRAAPPGSPSAITRTEYGRFGYMSTSTAEYVDQSHHAERIEKRRALHWSGLAETVAASALTLSIFVGLLTWLGRLYGPSNNRWRGP